MDEHLRKNKHWIGLGALVIIFLCVALCGLGAMATLFFRGGPTAGAVPYVQPPAGEVAQAAPPVVYGHSPMGIGWSSPLGFIGGAIGLLFRLAFFGLLLLLLIGLVKRLFWGPRWGSHHWAAHHPGMPPRGKPWKGAPHSQWGPPWAWRCAPQPGEAEPAAGSESDEPEEPDATAYNGPQE